MRISALIMVLATFALAQAPPAGPTPACGPENVSFKVKLDDSQHTLTPPDPGKARVYFLQDAGTSRILGYPT